MSSGLSEPESKSKSGVSSSKLSNTNKTVVIDKGRPIDKGRECEDDRIRYMQMQENDQDRDLGGLMCFIM